MKQHTAVILPLGPGKETALDTLQSIEHFCPETSLVVIVDDHTQDGTYEAVKQARRPHWVVLRNQRQQGVQRLAHSLAWAYSEALSKSAAELFFRIDQDALVIKHGLLAEAFDYMRRNPQVGMFGVYDVDYNRPRNYVSHRKLIDRETAWYRRLFGIRPSWSGLLRQAEAKGYSRGDNVFGGAYFLSRDCVRRMLDAGALDLPWNWHSILDEDVYFSMATVATGLKLGHFAAPHGPMCLEWRGLPYPAVEMHQSKFKVVHSVDKGKNTTIVENGGRSARQVFRDLRLSGD